MGQRANYIVIKDGGYRVHYSHWRANMILADLFKGEKVFLRYVEECELVDKILEEPWIEGCVVIDQERRKLWFWSFEAPAIQSVQTAILSSLEPLWKNWQIEILHGDMEDVSHILGIDISSDNLSLEPGDESLSLTMYEELDAFSSLVLIKEDSRFIVGRFGYQDIPSLLVCGKDLIRFVLENGRTGLPTENEVHTDMCLLIDLGSKGLYTSKHLYDHASALRDWQEYTLHEGLGPYLRVLQTAEIDVSGLKMTAEELEAMMETVQISDSDFDPNEMAKRLQAAHGDITFNPMFFDKVKPRITVWDRITAFFRRK